MNRRIIVTFFVMFLLLSGQTIYAMRVVKPPYFTDITQPDQRSQLNKFIEDTWLMQGGRFELDTVTTPKTNANDGELWIEDTGQVAGIGFMHNSTKHFIPAIEDGEAYDDIRVSGLSTKTNATAPDLVAFAPATTNLLTYGFNGDATTEQVYFAIQLPHSYKEGTNISPHVHWTPTDTNTGTVVWSLEYTWANNAGTFPAPTTITSPAVAAGGTAWVSKYSDFGDINGSGKTVSSMLICRLFRDPANDTYEHDAALLEVDFHYQIDSFGSHDELTK